MNVIPRQNVLLSIWHFQRNANFLIIIAVLYFRHPRRILRLDIQMRSGAGSIMFPHPRAKTSRAKLHGGTSHPSRAPFFLLLTFFLPPPPRSCRLLDTRPAASVLVGSLLFLLLFFFWLFGSPDRTSRGLVVISNPSSNLLRCWVLTEPLQIRHVNQSSFDVRSLN